MPGPHSESVRDLLLTTRGLVFVEGDGAVLPEDQLRVVEIELADLGYALGSRLRARLARCPTADLVELRTRTLDALRRHVGGDHTPDPLFRRFPEAIPASTESLWWQKFLSHYAQAPDQACLTCERTGTTHVLVPCGHVVCDQCFDGSSYSACPVCERSVDRGSPFFQPSPERPQPRERVVFRRLDLGGDYVASVRTAFTALCNRTQALSPSDRGLLEAIVREHGAQAAAWLPDRIPVRENIALVFGTLARGADPVAAVDRARPYLTSATDVLRLIAVRSGTDGSLQRETIVRPVSWPAPPGSLWERVGQGLGWKQHPQHGSKAYVAHQVCRFKVARMSRALRRALLGVLETLDADLLVEDMVRHRSYWIWVGEFLHPDEYAGRFPRVARAMHILRGRSLDGTPAPAFATWYGRVERSLSQADVDGLLAVLAERPGEFGRRVDLMLRLAQATPRGIDPVATAFAALIPRLATPMLLTLASHLRHRATPAPVRIYWPKGRAALGASAPDRRPLLPEHAVAKTIADLEEELLRRFARRPRFTEAIIDDALDAVQCPFNERTASQAAVQLPRGSRVAFAPAKLVRLFLHWCQPEGGSEPSDLDLSVALYDAGWNQVGVCSYYELDCRAADGSPVARHSGDRRDAPWPDGSSEYVDVDTASAHAAGARFAVMLVSNYSGRPFSQLARACAGTMLRDDAGGSHFDPRTVELSFALAGENGVFLPFVLDLEAHVLHWIDAYSRGLPALNHAANANVRVSRLCPELMAYFASGTRPSMRQLGLLHAAARCDRVVLRGERLRGFRRSPGESTAAFHARIVAERMDDRPTAITAEGAPRLACLYRGDLDLASGSCAYALFRERIVDGIAASDLLV